MEKQQFTIFLDVEEPITTDVIKTLFQEHLLKHNEDIDVIEK